MKKITQKDLVSLNEVIGSKKYVYDFMLSLATELCSLHKTDIKQFKLCFPYDRTTKRKMIDTIVFLDIELIKFRQNERS